MTTAYTRRMTEWVNATIFMVFGITIAVLGSVYGMQGITVTKVDASADIALNLSIDWLHVFSSHAVVLVGIMVMTTLGFDAMERATGRGRYD